MPSVFAPLGAVWELLYCRDVYTDLIDGQICCGVVDGSLRPEWEADAPSAYRRLAERCWHQETKCVLCCLLLSAGHDCYRVVPHLLHPGHGGTVRPALFR